MHLRLTFMIILCITFHNSKAEPIVKLLTTFIRENVVGNPTVHKIQHWPFHPDEGARRNPEFEALHGHRSYYLIERLGLGMDDHQAERKYHQLIRDIGVPTTSYDPKPEYDQQLQPILY